MSEVSGLLSYIIWIGVISVAALLIGVYGSRVLRKRLREQKRTEAFTVQELRQMRDSGRITPQEYQAMRTAVIAQMRAESPTRSRRHPDPRMADDPKTAESTQDPAADAGPDEQG